MCNNKDGPRDYHTKQSRSERQILYDIPYMQNPTYDTMNVSMKQKQNHRHREEIRGCQGGSRGRERRIRNLGLVDSSEK